MCSEFARPSHLEQFRGACSGPSCSTTRRAGRVAVSVTVVHLLRHGKVQNPGDILYGRLPGYRLAASGRAMAAGVADYLAGSDITYLAASSLQRAQETAAPMASTFGLPIVTDDRIIEAANEFEGVAFGLNGHTLGQAAEPG